MVYKITEVEHNNVVQTTALAQSTMNYYQVLLEGKNFLIDFDGEEKRSGFFTTRWVKADSPEAAEIAAVELIKSDESLAGITKNTNGSEPKPVIYAFEIAIVNWFTYFRCKPGKGYAFYSNENK